jgi:hypothetical protein
MSENRAYCRQGDPARQRASDFDSERFPASEIWTGFPVSD